MKKQFKKEIKKEFEKEFYEDVLNFSIANDDLTYWEATLLRKLIHISNTNEIIKYSNANLAKMLFRPNGENTVKNTVGKLVKKGFISSANIVISDGNEINKRRTIQINWDTIKKIYGNLPNYFEKDDSNLNEEPEHTPEPIEEPEVIIPEPTTNQEELITTFTNNFGDIITIDKDLVEFYNKTLINRKKTIENLKTYKHSDNINRKIREKKEEEVYYQ